MKAISAIFQKEFKSYFYSPIGYVILALFTALTGVFFYLYLSSFVQAIFMDMIRAQQYRMAPQKFNVNLMLIRPYFWNIALISLEGHRAVGASAEAIVNGNIVTVAVSIKAAPNVNALELAETLQRDITLNIKHILDMQATRVNVLIGDVIFPDNPQETS